jgi:hypothetical protein
MFPEVVSSFSLMIMGEVFVEDPIVIADGLLVNTTLLFNVYELAV